jgi:mono/diheme cytochrome c family protein
MRNVSLWCLMGALSLVGCNGNSDIGTCPTTSDVDSVTKAGKQDFQSNCNNCHRFPTEGISAVRAQSLFDTVYDGTMPPSGALPDQQIEEIRVFLACAADGGSGGGAP